MIYLILGILLLVLVYGGANWYRSADPTAIKGVALSLCVGLLAVLALFLLFTGRIGAAVAFGAGALGLFMRLKQAWGVLSFFKRHMSGSQSGDNRFSTVETSHLKMTLYHDKAQLDGEVIQGIFQGKKLSSLSLEQLREKRGELLNVDAEGVKLLEGFLDKAHPNWRQSGETGLPMNEEEACKILGVTPGSSEEEIRAAHKKLMKQLHPDSGGNSYLAAKINEARDYLLSDLGS